MFGRTDTFKKFGWKCKLLLQIHSHVRSGLKCYTCGNPTDPLHTKQPLLSHVDITNQDKLECELFYHDLITSVTMENVNNKPLLIFDGRELQHQYYTFVPQMRIPDIHLMIKALDCNSTSVSKAMFVARHQPKGLALYNNKGYACYINVNCNLLNSVHEFMSLINSGEDHYILDIFRELFQSPQSPKDADIIRMLVSTVKTEYANFNHQDCHLFLNCLMDLCPPMKDLFTFIYKKTFKCVRCNKESEGSEELVTSLDITHFDGETLKELIEKNMTMQTTIKKRCYTKDCYKVDQQAQRSGGILGSDHIQTEKYQPTSKILLVKANIMDYQEVDNVFVQRKIGRKIIPTETLVFGDIAYQLRNVTTHLGNYNQ